MRIILASESPFRKRAMDLLGLPYETRPSRIDEKAIRDDDPVQLTRKIAEAKAQRIARECPNAVIVSGDAVAAKGQRIFEKPRNQDEAASFLREFSGSQFQFVTAISVLNTQTSRMLSAVETSDIFFRPLIEREIRRYINRYDVVNYAGRLRKRRSPALRRPHRRKLQPRNGAAAEPPDRPASRARSRRLVVVSVFLLR